MSHPDATTLQIQDWLNNAGVGQFTVYPGLRRYIIPLSKVFKYVVAMRYDIIEAGKREGVAGERTGTQPLRTARFDNRGLPRIAKTLLYHSKPIMPSTRVGAIGLPAVRHSRAGAPLCAVYGAEAARVLCAWCANSRRAAPDMLTGNSSGQEHGVTAESTPAPPHDPASGNRARVLVLPSLP